MKTGDNQSPWKMVVIIPAIAIVAAGIASAVSDGLRERIKNIFSNHSSHDTVPGKQIRDSTTRNTIIPTPKSHQVTVQLVLTNNKLPLKNDTVIFDKKDTIFTDDAGVCFKEIESGIHNFQIHAYNKIFHYSFHAPDRADSLYSLLQDINYAPPIMQVASAPTDTIKKTAIATPPPPIRIPEQAKKLPFARVIIQTNKLSKGN